MYLNCYFRKTTLQKGVELSQLAIFKAQIFVSINYVIKRAYMNTKKRTPEVAEPCTKQQLAKELGVSISTLKRKLTQAELTVPRGLIPPKAKQDILQKLKWW